MKLIGGVQEYEELHSDFNNIILNKISKID